MAFKEGKTCKGSWFVLGLFLTGVVATLLFVGCNEQQAASPPQGRPPTPVRVATAINQEVQRSVTLVGTVEPWRRSEVASEIAGLVEAFLIEEGMSVKKGQMLARLRIKTLNIRLNSAVAFHREAQTRHDQAGKDLERVKVLFGKELVTQKEYDDGVAQERALRLRLTQLESVIMEVRDQLARSRIAAPFDGWVTKEFTEVGQWVEEGGPIVEMVDLSRVQVEVPLPERYLQDVRVDDPVKAVFDGLPGFEAEGQVFSVVAQADRVARTFPVKIALPNPLLAMKSGMVSRVTIRVGAPYEAVVVPKDALVLRGGKEFLFLVEEGKVLQSPVISQAYVSGMVEVAGEVRPGAVVVVEGNERLRSGQGVRILEPTG